MDREKKISIMIICVVGALVLLWAGFWLYDYFLWKPVLQNQQEFVESWGTYSYNDFKDYPARVKPYLSDDMFKRYFGDPQSLEIQAGRMLTKKYSVETVSIKNTKKEKSGSEVAITTQVKESVSSANESYEKEKTVLVTWDYTDPENPVVTNIEYQ